MSDEPKWDITRLTDEELAGYVAEQEEETLRRKRLNRWWVCMSCGVRMGYDYMEGGLPYPPFDESGCRACGHAQAIEVVEDTTGE